MLSKTESPLKHKIGYIRGDENTPPNSPSGKKVKRKRARRGEAEEREQVAVESDAKREKVVPKNQPSFSSLLSAVMQPAGGAKFALELLFQQADLEIKHSGKGVFLQCVGDTLQARICTVNERNYKSKEVDFVLCDAVNNFSVVKYIKVPVRTLTNPKPSYKKKSVDFSDSDPLFKALTHASKIQEYLEGVDAQFMLVFDLTDAGHNDVPAAYVELLCKQLQARVKKMPGKSVPPFNVLFNHNGYYCLTKPNEFIEPSQQFFQPAKPKSERIAQRLNLLMEIAQDWPTEIDREDKYEVEDSLNYFNLLQNVSEGLCKYIGGVLESGNLSAIDAQRVPILMQRAQAFNTTIQETAADMGLINQLQANFR